jgi:hypothetical protein
MLGARVVSMAWGAHRPQPAGMGPRGAQETPSSPAIVSFHCLRAWIWLTVAGSETSNYSETNRIKTVADVQTRVNTNGRRVRAKPPIDISIDRHGNKLTDKQVETRKRMIRKNGKRTVARGAEYFVYIRSDAWRETKRRYMLSGMPKDCCRCGRAWERSFELHHMTYKNLGCEKLTDLRLVCRECHQRIHDLAKANDYPIWKATVRSCHNEKRRIKKLARQF